MGRRSVGTKGGSLLRWRGPFGFGRTFGARPITPQSFIAMEKTDRLVLWFDEIDRHDVPLVGGKAASLGEMYRELVPRRVPVPGGFATTARAFSDFGNSTS